VREGGGVATAVLVDVVRTAVGARHGGLSGWHPADLAGSLLASLAERSDLDPFLVEDVLVGCVTQHGDQAANLARSAVLAAGWPESVPGATVDRQCASGQQAVHLAAQAVLAGALDVVVAAGVECMSTTPPGSTITIGSRPFGPAVLERYAAAGGLIPPGAAAELVAERWSLSRADLDAYAATSHARAAAAAAEGRFAREIVALTAKVRDRDTGQLSSRSSIVRADEMVGRDVGSLAEMKPAFDPSGRITAANSAPAGDGAAAALIMSEERAARLGLRARARFVSFAVAAGDPLETFTATIPATARALERAKLDLGDVDVAEVNEAFAPAVLAWARETGGDLARVNPNGGAIAIGHPLGCTGVRMLATLVHELERSGGRYGLQTVAAAGGLATALVVERV